MTPGRTPRVGWLAFGLGLSMSLTAHGQAIRPLPRGAPEAIAAPGLSVSVVVSEGLDPDRLRSLARPGVTAWVETRSNTLAESVMENLARFDRAWVELRAPLGVGEAEPLRRVPHLGAWGTVEAMAMARRRLPSTRRVAVEHRGPLGEEAYQAIAALRPEVVRWWPPESIDLLGWALFSSLGGRKVLVAPPALALLGACARRGEQEPAVEVHLAVLLAQGRAPSGASEGLAFPCGRGARVVVDPRTEGWMLQSLLASDPTVELVIRVEADDAQASRASRLLDQLGLGPPR